MSQATTSGLAPKRAKWRYLPALDGLRGLAVLAVVLYHAGVSWLPGGLLGVDTFFVLSGFLITGLLLAEAESSGRIQLRTFWARRARRLLPALLLLIVLVSVLVALTGTAAEQARYPKDAFSALGYVANWRFAFSNQGYFSAGSHSPLLHLWSLGIEEQFYLVWPVIVVLLLRRSARAPAYVARLGIGAALLSAGWMALGAAVLHWPADRLYYGTDTHASALLMGASLAALRANRTRFASRRAHSSSQAALSLAGVAGLVVLCTSWAVARGPSAWLYRGGFLLVAISVVAVLAAVAELPDSVLTKLLSAPPLVALGRISYGVYLFHWPLFLALDHARTGMSGANLLLARLAATLTIAAASYVLLEEPVRTGRLRLPHPRLTIVLTAGSAAAAILLAATLPASGAREDQTFTANPAKLQLEAANRLASPATGNTAPNAQKAAAGSAAAGPTRILIVGDSIAFSAAWALAGERQQYRVDLSSDAIIGCGIVPWPYANPNTTSPVPLTDCTGWQRAWASSVQSFRPAVSAVFLGRWEITNRVERGQTVHIGEPVFDAELSRLLDRAITTLSARGGKVGLVALPCFVVPELADGSSSQPDAARRGARYNELLAEAAARHPKVASVIDLNSEICPGGRVISRFQGVPLREADGMHFDPRSGPVLGPLLLTPLLRLTA